MYQSESDYPRKNKQYEHIPSSGYGKENPTEYGYSP